MRAALVLLTAATLLALLLVIAASGPNEPGEREVLACFAAQDAVKQRLAVTARFPSCLNAEGVTADGHGGYVVRSHFESPDAAGVYRARHYGAVVDDEGHSFHAYIADIR